MKKFFALILLLIICNNMNAQKIRKPVDAVGFATEKWQMDSLVKRIHSYYQPFFDSSQRNKEKLFRAAICPHDDYTYAGYLYESVLPYVKAKTVIIFGVAHKAKKYNVEQKLVFDSFEEWKEPYGNILIPALREDIMKNLPADDYIIHDSLQQAEHSVEAIIPFLQYHNKNVKIISILVPFMDFRMMEKYSQDLSKAIEKMIKEKHLKWGEDIAFVISNDAVHYGDEDWGGQNYAIYGCDQSGYEKAVQHENEIISTSLLAAPDTATADKFFGYTVKPDDWRSYQWPWCGRYSVPFGLLTAMNLGKLTGDTISGGILKGYGTSISREPLPVEDLKMGKTAVANLHHWVGYAAIGYR